MINNLPKIRGNRQRDLDALCVTDILMILINRLYLSTFL